MKRGDDQASFQEMEFLISPAGEMSTRTYIAVKHSISPQQVSYRIHLFGLEVENDANNRCFRLSIVRDVEQKNM